MLVIESTAGDPDSDLPENLPRIMPPRRCVRASSRRTRSRFNRLREAQQNNSFWMLPDELMLQLMRTLHIKDLLNLRSTHPYLRDIIDGHTSIWSTLSFCDTWPTQKNLKHFDKAARHGNVESLVKLGVAYLYNEGLPGDFEGKKITKNGEKAASMFCQVEALTPHTAPFSWLFIRPPWAAAGACCKECVFNNMKAFVAKHPDHSVHVCIAKTLHLLEDDSRTEEMVTHLKQAVEVGSPVAPYLLWQHNYKDKEMDRTSELHSLRELREVASRGHLDSQLELCKQYCQGVYGGISRSQAVCFVRGFVQASRPTDILSIYSFQQLTHSMRYILVDWLVEVANMKDFSTLTLHVAIDVVDRYLKTRGTTRAKLQLMGVAAMVLCSRFLGKDIITIREAAWLTDNTYNYEDVVRMMGEITAALKGNFRNVLYLDYTELFGLLAGNDTITQWQAQFICELALLQSEMGAYPTAKVAASAVLLARLAQKKDTAWPSQMGEFTGYEMKDISPCALHLHHLCFVERSMFDHRNVELQAVKMRYSEDDHWSVSKLPVMKEEDLLDILGVEMGKKEAAEDINKAEAKSVSPSSHNLIMSPSRKSKKEVTRPCELSFEREQAATPTLDKSFTDTLNESHASTMSGYEGDREDESFVNAGAESDADLESLWCSDMDSTANRAMYDADLDSSALNDSGMSNSSLHMTDGGEAESFSFMHTSSKAAAAASSNSSLLVQPDVNPQPSASQFISPPPGVLSISNTQFLTPSPVSISFNQLISPAPGSTLAQQFISPPPGLISNFQVMPSSFTTPKSHTTASKSNLYAVSSIKSGQSGVFILGGGGADLAGASNTTPNNGGVRIYQDKSPGLDSGIEASAKKVNLQSNHPSSRGRHISAAASIPCTQSNPNGSHGSGSVVRSHTFEDASASSTTRPKSARSHSFLDAPSPSTTGENNRGLAMRDMNMQNVRRLSSKDRQIVQVKRKSSQTLGNDSKTRVMRPPYNMTL